MTTHCNGIDNLVPFGNDFYLAVTLKSRSLVDGEVVETPFDFEAADSYDARIYGILDGKTLSTMVGLKDGSTDTVIIDAKGVPLIRAIGVEVTGEVDGRAFRAAEKGFLSIVDFNGEAKVVFTPVTGGQQANLLMSLTFLPSAAVVGKNAYEIWKEEPGNEDKTLADFIYFLGHGESAYEIAVRYGYTGTEAEYNMLYFDSVDVANTAGQNAQQAADTANQMAAQAQDAAERADAATTNANNAATAAAATVDAAIDNMENTLNAAIAAQNAEIASKEAEIDAEFATQTMLINQKQMEIGAVPSDLVPTAGSTNWVTSGGVYDAVNSAENRITSLANIIGNVVNLPITWANGVVNGNTGAIVTSTTRCYSQAIEGKMRTIAAKTLDSAYYIHTIAEYSSATIGTSTFIRAIQPQDTTLREYSITTENYVVIGVAKTNNGNITTSDAGHVSVFQDVDTGLNVKGVCDLQGAGKVVDLIINSWTVGRLDASGANEASNYHLRSPYIRENGIIELYAGQNLYIESVFVYNSSGTMISTIQYNKSLERYRYTVSGGNISRVVLKRRDGTSMTADMGNMMVGSHVQHNSRILTVENRTEDVDIRLTDVENKLVGGVETSITLHSGGYWRTNGWSLYTGDGAEGYSYSDPFQVYYGQRIKVTLSVGGGCYGVWGCATNVFSSSGVPIVDISTEVHDLVVTIPQGVNYIFISSRNQNFTPSFTPSAFYFTGGWLDEKIERAIESSAFANPFNGLKLVTLGDSIMQGQVMDGTAPSKPFPVLVAEELGMTLVNYGIGGSTIGTCENYGGTFASIADFNAATKDTSKYYVVMTGRQTYSDYRYNGSSWVTTTIAMRTPLVDRYNLMDADADIILVAGGTNDFQYNWAAIGEVSDVVSTTFRGALNNLCNGLVTKYPQKCIIFMTPIKRCQTQQAAADRADTTAHRGGSYGTIDSQNDFGKTLKDYGDIIKEICARYSIPVIDMYAECMLNPQLSAQSGLFDSYKTHPYQEGHNLMARLIVGKLKSIFGMDI